MKRGQQIKRAKRLVKGLKISWSDPEPLSENQKIANEMVTHTNAVLRPNAMKVWCDYRDWIVYQQVFLWKIRITGVRHYPNGQTQQESRLAIARAKLEDIAVECEDVIKVILRYVDASEMQFEVECLGDRQANDNDFEDYEAA